MWECKHCRYMREDEPKEDWETCPNCDNFNWMKEGERNDIAWTAEPPTKPGWYWVYYPKNTYPDGAVCVQVGFDTDGKPHDIGNIDDPWLLDNATHFLGPLPVPEPPS